MHEQYNRKQDNKDIFDMANPAPRNEVEKQIHSKLAAAWQVKTGREPYGIVFYTADEEAKLRRGEDFQGDPSMMDPRWIGRGPVTAVVTVPAAGIERGEAYQELANVLRDAAPEVSVELSPWPMEPPAGHTLAR